MLIGIISDSHDNIWNLGKALGMLKERKVDRIIHCGDLCAPFIIDELDKAGIPADVIFGNIDDRYMTTKKSEASKYVTHHGDIARLELDGKMIAVTHNDTFAEGLADTFRFDVVFHGHTHRKRDDSRGKTRLINPGEIMGRNGSPSFAIYDTVKNEVEFVDF